MNAQTSLGDFSVSQHDTDESTTTNTDEQTGHRVVTDGGADADLDFNYDELRYIRVADGKKQPIDAWGGYSQDFEDADDVYMHEEVCESDHDEWGVVGIDAPDGHDWYTFILDIDIHKSDDYDVDDIVVTDAEDTPIVKSQNGGVHVYFALHESVKEADIDLVHPWIDLQGSATKSHVVAPRNIPGCEGSDYDLVNDTEIPVFFSVGEVLDRVNIGGEPIGEHDPSDPLDVDFERGEAPDEMPTCYYSALSFRSSEAREEHPNAFKIDTFAGMLGLAAGYSVDDVTEHFGEFAPHGTEFDEQLTRDHLKKLARKLDNGALVPPAISTLREHGILAAGESCTCSIEYHGSAPSPKTSGTSGGSSEGFHSASDLQFDGNTCGWYDEVKRDDGSTEYVWREVANFRLEALSYLFEEGERLIELRVIPSTGEESYEVTVPATVFNDVRKFKNNVVTGITTTWSGSAKRNHLDELRKLVGSQDAPVRQGVNYLGLNPETGEFLTPNGVLTEGGWTDDPESVLIDGGSTPEASWDLDPDTHTEYDADEVLDIIDLVTSMRNTERFLPVLGWLYTTPVRPYIQSWEGEFNSVHVSGETGSGKSTSLSILSEMVGLNGEPMKVDDTKFAMVQSFSSTRSVPLWFDEYKPSDLKDYEVDRFQNLLRDATKGNQASRGTQSQTTNQYPVKAPVMVSGEQRLQGSAEERRSIVTRFLKNVQEEGSEMNIAFSKLTGKDYRGESGDLRYPQERDLSQHAFAYIQFVLSLDESELRSLWRESKEHVADLLETAGIEGMESLPRQGLQTIHFGITLAEKFAESMAEEADASADVIPSPDELDEAILYSADEMGAREDGRKNHLDDFIELASRASQADYLERGTHYTVVNEGAPDEQLAFHLPSVHDAVSKYARDHDITGVDLLNSASDYRDHMQEHADKNDSYVVTHSQVTPPLNRCARIDPEHAADTLDFNLRAFGLGDEPVVEEQSLEAAATPISELSTSGNPYATVTVQCLSWREPMSESGPTEQGAVSDATGTVDIVDWMGASLDDSLEEDEYYVLKDVRVSSYNDAIQLEVVQGVTEAETIQQGVGHTSHADAGENQAMDAVADGGRETDTDGPDADDDPANEDSSSDSSDDNDDGSGEDTTSTEESSSEASQSESDNTGETPSDSSGIEHQVASTVWELSDGIMTGVKRAAIKGEEHPMEGDRVDEILDRLLDEGMLYLGGDGDESVVGVTADLRDFVQADD
ncbi:hypothetical protein ACFQDG_01140 [Natronoarchaeum mannanilyticum]|uniref:DUF927 domain-containing protein n=1 Tax=Natronoarchaeum mannanilyticum TaxID=926360 RepID=A0AAV3TCS8_9EURY